jgi:hypothetical protein
MYSFTGVNNFMPNMKTWAKTMTINTTLMADKPR